MPHLTPPTVHVIIIDDDARVRRALRALIESAGSAVVAEATTMTDIKALGRTHDSSVILLDLMTANPRDGLDLLTRLAADKNHPVVAMSTRSGLRDAAIRAGAQGFLDKGEAPDRILATVRLAASAGVASRSSGLESHEEMM